MPDGEFMDLTGIPSWVQYRLAGGSALHALNETEAQKNDPDGVRTLFVQLDVGELSLVTTGLLVLLRLMPEFKSQATALSLKFHQVAEAQDFLKGIGGGTLDDE